MTVACSTGPASVSSGVAADCEVLVRYADRTYVATGTTVDAAEAARWPVLAADGALSACSDTGPSPRGASFPDDAASVSIVALPDVDADVAVGYRRPGQDTVVVATGEQLSSRERRDLEQRFRPGPDERPLVHAGVRALRGYLMTWADEGPVAAGRYLVPGQRADDQTPQLVRGRLTSWAVAGRDPQAGTVTLLVTLDLTFRGSPMTWSRGSNARFVTLHRDGQRVLLELASGP